MYADEPLGEGAKRYWRGIYCASSYEDLIGKELAMNKSRIKSIGDRRWLEVGDLLMEEIYRRESLAESTQDIADVIWSSRDRID